MLKKNQVDELETLIGQLRGLHTELTLLTKKSASDAVNAFKLKFVNATLTRSNAFLGKQYRPFTDFIIFDLDDVPSNSDVTFVIAQYQEAFEKLRSDNVYQEYGNWYYRCSDSPEIRTSPPIKLGK